MAQLVPDLAEAGAHIIGGCCGTTPEHIRAFRRAVDPN
jgi:5-methyltetrahydrofolate--homocysteine methyltransferase